MRTPRKLSVESLENRALLAGNVSVSVSGNTLVIVGDNAGNGVAVEQLDNGRFFVSGYSLHGAATTINGGTGGRIVSGVRHIDVDLNQGWDAFLMSNSAWRREQLAQGFSGGTAGPVQRSPQPANSNTVHPVTTRVAGDVTIRMDEGNDDVGIGARIGTLNSNGGIVDGVLNIIGGIGHDRVITDRTQAFDDMLYDMGSGNDHVHADITRAGDFVFAALGDGDDAFLSNNSHGWHTQVLGGAGNDGIYVGNYRFEQEVAFDGGSGNDIVVAGGLSGISIAIVTGDGADSITVNGSTSRGGYTVDTGSGSDFVRLSNTFAAGHLGVFLGDQNDTLRIGNTETDDTTLSGGSGFDQYFNDGGNILRSLSRSGFEQSA
jgi:hypothetical protein